jgi:hypothetical protein
MFSGPPLPLLPTLPLSRLFAQAQRQGILGAWVRGSTCALHLFEAGGPGRRILLSHDLGFLLRRCSHVALREGQDFIVLEAEAVIRWRTLQVVTGSPYLPGLERLAHLFPGLMLDQKGFTVPLKGDPVGGVLAECLSSGVPVTGSRIVYFPH